MYDQYVSCLADGSFSHLGATVNRHTISQKSVKIVRNETTKLDDVSRWWSCQRPGFWGILNLDNWLHHESCTWQQDGTLQVKDEFLWHKGKSSAHRVYTVVRCSDGQAQRKEDGWVINMSGLPWMVRNKVTSAMREALPAASQKTYERFLL